MKVFWALLQKEFGNFFKSGSAFWLMLIYLVTSVASAFYYGAYLLAHDTAVYALFLPQPLILSVLVPALTVRSWTSEYRLGTAELLLTQPLSNKVLVAAKVFAVWLLLSMMTLFLLPFVLYTATWLYLDWGNVLTCWLGLELLIFLFAALGCMISCLCHQPAMSYLSGVVCMLLLSGVPFLGLYATYKNFVLAQIGVADAAYFIFFGSAFCFLNMLALNVWRKQQQSAGLRLGIFGALLVCAVALLVSALAYFLPYKADFTSARIYSLKTETVNLVNRLKEAVTIDIYAAQDYLRQNPEQRLFVEQIQRLLQKYQTQSRGMVSVRFKTVEAFSDEEAEILQQGLFYQENTLGSRNYFGAILRHKSGETTVVRQFLPQRQAFAEKDIDIAILKLAEPERKRAIGVYLDGAQNLDPFVGLFVNLENDYNVINIEDNVYHLSDKLNTLILVNPKKLPKVFMYAIDQYLMNGGKLIVFFDFFTQSQTENINAKNIDITEFFANWDIELQKGLKDMGALASMFITGRHNLSLHSAAAFKVTNSALNVTPFITVSDGYIGAVISGKINSNYDANPFADNNPSLRLLPYTSSVEGGKLALIGDVDLLDEANWLSPRSPDRNPHSAIALSANGEAVRALIDHMSGNDIYRLLPVNTKASNEQSISEQMNAGAQKIYARQIRLNQENLQQLRAVLYLQSGADADRLKQMAQISAAGQDLAKAEQQSDNLAYLVAKAYKNQTHRAVIGQVFIVPLLSVLLLYFLLKCLSKRRRQKIRGKLYE